MPFLFETAVRPDWIDCNGHMREPNFRLVFSLAVDALQDEIGIDADYRKVTGCTIYLSEDHRFYLREVYAGDMLRVATSVLDVDEKRFHLHKGTSRDGTDVCVGEFVELHVKQKPKPHAAPMPEEARQRLEAARIPRGLESQLSHRARAIALRRQ